MNGQSYVNDFKLNGAVTSICKFGEHIAVSTSQGDLHLYEKFKFPFIRKTFHALILLFVLYRIIGKVPV